MKEMKKFDVLEMKMVIDCKKKLINETCDKCQKVVNYIVYF